MTGDWQDAIARARANAPFLARALDRQPELEALLRDGDGEAALAWAREAGAGAPTCEIALRRERLGLAAALAVGVASLGRLNRLAVRSRCKLSVHRLSPLPYFLLLSVNPGGLDV